MNSRASGLLRQEEEEKLGAKMKGAERQSRSVKHHEKPRDMAEEPTSPEQERRLHVLNLEHRTGHLMLQVHLLARRQR